MKEYIQIFASCLKCGPTTKNATDWVPPTNLRKFDLLLRYLLISDLAAIKIVLTKGKYAQMK